MSAKLMPLACTRTRSAPVARLRVGRFAQLQSVWATATADEDLLHGLVPVSLRDSYREVPMLPPVERAVKAQRPDTAPERVGVSQSAWGAS